MLIRQATTRDQPELARLHLQIRTLQQEVGEFDFEDLEASQTDLLSLDEYSSEPGG